MTLEEELNELRAWKKNLERRPIDEAFFRLEQTLANPYSRGFDAVMPVMAFRILAECIIQLKKELIK